MRLEGHRGPIGGVCYHPSGSRIASAGHDGEVYIWDTASGDLLIRIPILDGSALHAIEWSPDGQQLATVNRGGDLIVLGSAENVIPRATDVPTKYEKTTEEELAKLTLAISEESADHKLLLERAHWYAKHLRWQEAQSDFEKFLEANPSWKWQRCEAGFAALMCNDAESYRRHLDAAIQEVPGGDSLAGRSIGVYLAELAAMVPDAVEDYTILLPLAHRHGQARPEIFHEVQTIFMIELRIGNHERVLELLNSHLDRGPYKSQQVIVDAIRAICLHELGRDGESRAALRKAEDTATEAWPQPGPESEPDYGDLRYYVQANVFLREAGRLLSQETDVDIDAIE